MSSLNQYIRDSNIDEFINNIRLKEVNEYNFDINDLHIRFKLEKIKYIHENDLFPMDEMVLKTTTKQPWVKYLIEHCYPIFDIDECPYSLSDECIDGYKKRKFKHTIARLVRISVENKSRGMKDVVDLAAYNISKLCLEEESLIESFKNVVGCEEVVDPPKQMLNHLFSKCINGDDLVRLSHFVKDGADVTSLLWKAGNEDTLSTMLYMIREPNSAALTNELKRCCESLDPQLIKLLVDFIIQLITSDNSQPPHLLHEWRMSKLKSLSCILETMSRPDEYYVDGETLYWNGDVQLLLEDPGVEEVRLTPTHVICVDDGDESVFKSVVTKNPQYHDCVEIVNSTIKAFELVL